ncbi:MAG: tandem-95 repeat protein [Saprospiraceae bacterium]|nr:tandem-95 repeat protein [Saprospiraceae bacterium]
MSNTTCFIALIVGFLPFHTYLDWFSSGPIERVPNELTDTIPIAPKFALTAVTDYTDVSEDVAVRIPILINDIVGDDQGSDLQMEISLQQQGRNGSAEVDQQENHVIYRPNRDFYGLDSLTYQICIGDTHCDDAKILVTVHPINDMPSINDDQIHLAEDTWIEFDPMQNDHDTIDNQSMDAMSLTILTSPRFGTLDNGESGMYRYTPRPNYFGGDYFTYRICENDSSFPVLCDTANVFIQVQNVNDPPIANADFDTTFQNFPIVLDLMENDFDEPNEQSPENELSLSLTDLQGPMHGSVHLDKSVELVIYSPAEDYIGIDSFSYRLCDQGPGLPLCDTSQVVISISLAQQTD